MADNATTNLGLISPNPTEDPNNNFNTDRYLKENWQKVDDEIDILSTKINKGVTQSPTVGFGIQNIKYTGLTPVFPTIEFYGKHYANILGKDGDCEDISKWSAYQTTLALDPSNVVFGSNSIKITSTVASVADMYIPRDTIRAVDTTKYYMFSAYLKNYNFTSIKLVASDTSVVSPLVTTTTDFVRVCLKLTPANMSSMTSFAVYGASTVIGQYGYVDGIMINEISSEDYALSDADLLAKYPYVESVGSLQNPYFENRQGNMFNESKLNPATSGRSSATFMGGKVVFNNTGNTAVRQEARSTVWLTKGKSYVFAKYNEVVTSGAALSICHVSRIGEGTGLQQPSMNAPFVFTGDSGFYEVAFLGTTNETNVVSANLMFVESTTHPTTYYPCKCNAFNINGKFFNDDHVKIEAGRLSGERYWKHTTLFGKDYTPAYNYDYTGFKRITITLPQLSGLPLWASAARLNMTKYDGLVLKNSGTVDIVNSYTANSDNFLFTIADTDSGWADNIAPNADEIKAYLNGWKAYLNDGTRYKAWYSVDGSGIPNMSATATNAGSSSTVINVASHSFVAGDVIYSNYVGSTRTISSVTATTITLGTAASWAVGSMFSKVNDATNSVLNYCANNLAPNYSGYKLDYKMTNPEPITDANYPIDGTIWSLENGDNYVTIDSGIVLGEIATPVLDSGYGLINYKPNTLTWLENPAEYISAIYKTGVYDILWYHQSDINAVGKDRLNILAANYDSNALYTVDYQILKSLHAQAFTSLVLSYAEGVISSVESLAEAMENKQQQDSALDNLIDLSEYEEIQYYIAARATQYNPTDNAVTVYIPFTAKKKCTPTVTFANVTVNALNSLSSLIDITSKANIRIAAISKTGMTLTVGYAYNDANTPYIMNYGLVLKATIKLDCSGRI